MIKKIESARLILKSSIESKLNYSLSGMLRYEDDLFWNTRQRDSSDYSESFTCELIGSCAVFSFHFKVYRALCQGGIVYPPKFLKISIGNSIDDFHFVSKEFRVPVSEKLATIQILPQIVIGRYIKVELIGLVTQMAGSNSHIAALEFIEVVGSPMEDLPIGNLEKAIFSRNLDIFCDVLSRNKHKASPFIVDLISRKGLLFEYLSRIDRDLNEAESFLYTKSLLDSSTFPKNGSSLSICKYSEALGDLLFEAGAFSSAFSVYARNQDIWKLCKTAIVLKNSSALKQILQRREPRYPMYSDLVKIASALGKEFEEFLIKELG
jgi:hypothetical protein